MSKISELSSRVAGLAEKLERARTTLNELEGSNVHRSFLTLDIRSKEAAVNAYTTRVEFVPDIRNSTDYAEVARRLAIHYYRDMISDLEKSLREALAGLRECQI